MKFLDLHAQYLSIRKDIDRAIQQTLESSEFIMGKSVFELEKKIASYCGVRYGISLNSGTDALYLALRALNLKVSDEVIVPAFTFFATAEVVALAGATPVFADITPGSFTIDPVSVEKKITKKTRAIMPVHLYGELADMRALMGLSRAHNIPIIEDAAQALGASLNGEKACSFGSMGCISFFPSKNLGAYGDGGMLVTNDERVATFARMWRVHGSEQKYNNIFIGDSSRLDNIQAAILLAKFPHLDTWNAKRAEKAALYNSLLDNRRYGLPIPTPASRHIYHQYTIRVRNGRDRMKEALANANIPTMVYYPTPLHLQKAFTHLGYHRGDLPESERACTEVLSLPIYPELADDDIRHVVEVLNSLPQ